MSEWTIFAVGFTVLLLGTGLTVTIFEFYRADRRMRKAELRKRRLGTRREKALFTSAPGS